jgi:hypothetical protein
VAHWLLVFFGIDNEAGRGYAFWSGFGSDIGEFAIIGLLYQLVRRHNCHVKRCIRIGRHKTGDHVVCAKHHPRGAPSASDVL